MGYDNRAQLVFSCWLQDASRHIPQCPISLCTCFSSPYDDALYLSVHVFPFSPRFSARATDSEGSGEGVSTTEGVSRGENGDAKPDVGVAANTGDGEIPLPWRFLLCCSYCR